MGFAHIPGAGPREVLIICKITPEEEEAKGRGRGEGGLAGLYRDTLCRGRVFFRVKQREGKV